MLKTHSPPPEVIYLISYTPTPSHHPLLYSYHHIYLNTFPEVDLGCFNLIPLINLHTVVTARWTVSRFKKKKRSLSFEWIYYWCMFFYVIIKASPSPPINFMLLFIVHGKARLQCASLSSHRLHRFIVLCREEMLHYIKQEFTAALKCRWLEDPFKWAMFVKD